MQVNIADHGYTIIYNGVYYFALSDYPNISGWELKKLLTFMGYEKQHGRETEIVCEDDKILTAVNYAIAHPQKFAAVSLPGKITECTACKQKGCLTKFVCHTASAESAVNIFSGGKLLSAVKALGKTSLELVGDKRNACGDPADFFDYIMFAWGNCSAGDRLVMERSIDIDPDNFHIFEEALENSLAPGARFYFKYENIVKHPGYVFDGYHPAKIKDELTFADCLYACVIPQQYKSRFEGLLPPEIADRIHFLPQNSLGLFDWTEKVYNFIQGLEEN